MKQTQFFATREDVLSLLQLLEQEAPLRYIRTGNELNPDFEIFARASDIPELGVASHETGIACESFLVMKANQSPSVRTLMGHDGKRRYLMDQLCNPNSVGLTPAGIWGEIILQGVVGTASDSAVSMELMKQFNAGFRKLFRKAGMRFVGEQAFTLWKSGRRLTIAEQSPPQFDLTA